MKTITTHGLVLGPLLAATLREHKAEIVRAEKNDLNPIELIELTVLLALAAGRRVDPTLTVEKVEAIVDADNAGVIYAACWGIAVPEPAPGEGVAVGNPSS